MNNLYTFNGLQLSEQLTSFPKQVVNIQKIQSQKLVSQNSIHPRQTKRIRRYQQIVQICNNQQRKKQTLIKNKTSKTLKDFLETNIQNVNQTRNPFSTTDHEKYQLYLHQQEKINQNKNCQSPALDSQLFTFYKPRQQKKQDKEQSNEMIDKKTGTKKKRSFSLKQAPKLYFPNNRKLPIAFRIKPETILTEDRRKRVVSVNSAYQNRCDFPNTSIQHHFKQKIDPLPIINKKSDQIKIKIGMSQNFKRLNQEVAIHSLGDKIMKAQKVLKIPLSKGNKSNSTEMKNMRRCRLASISSVSQQNQQELKIHGSKKC